MNPVTSKTSPAGTPLLRLLRGEIAAAETYTQILQVADAPDAHALRPMQDNHGRAIKFLAEQLSQLGIQPPTSSGAWGNFARAMEGGAKLFGMKAALTTLRKGERTGLTDYEDVLKADLPLQALPEPCRQYIQTTLVPTQCQHIELLDRLIDAK